MIDVGDTIKRTIVQRAYKLQYDRVYDILGGKPFILAGGALCGDTVHDFDIYPVKTDPYTCADLLRALRMKKPVDVSIVAQTKNALTVLLSGGQVVQFCSYSKPSLEELVKSFDFSHIQVGVMFAGNHETPHTDGVYYTDAFVMSNVTRCSDYTGSEYPTSSIVRTLKYYKRGKMSRASAGRSILKAMTDVISRGFNGYEDFKDQLDAIDLGLPDCTEARAFFEAVRDAGLIRDKTIGH